MSDAAGTVEARIRRVERGLVPTAARWDEPPPPETVGDRMRRHHTPGLSVAVVHGGQVEWARGYGVRKAGSPAPVTPATLFQAGSISKPVTAVAVLGLVQEGRLALDEDVNRYLTSWQVPANGAWQPPVTLRQLLSHTGGVTVHGFPGYPAGAPVPTALEVLDGLPPANTPRVRVDTVPGVHVRYAGGGTTIVQQLLVDVLGAPFPELMRERVLAPLGMDASTYEQPLPAARRAAAATGHPWGRPLAGGCHTYPEMAAAGLWTTPSDLARLVVALQRAAAGDDCAILAPAVVAEMLTAQEETAALGFFLAGPDDARRFGHGGWDEGFTSELVAYRERGLGAVVMASSNLAPPLIQEVLRAVAREYAWHGYLPDDAAGGATDSERAGAYAGEYELRPGFRFRVTETDGTLAVDAPGQAPIRLEPRADGRYALAAADAEISFVRARDGTVSGLVFQQNGRDTTVPKIA